jgi:hypothetical protein
MKYLWLIVDYFFWVKTKEAEETTGKNYLATLHHSVLVVLTFNSNQVFIKCFNWSSVYQEFDLIKCLSSVLFDQVYLKRSNHDSYFNQEKHGSQLYQVDYDQV